MVGCKVVDKCWSIDDGNNPFQVEIKLGLTPRRRVSELEVYRRERLRPPDFVHL